MARPPKFDYDADDFYDEILALAMQGCTDAEIASALEEKFGETLDDTTFSCMKNGKYREWTEEENKRRSDRLNKVLTRGRNKTNVIARGRYLKAALGGIKIKSSVKKWLTIQCDCEGDIDCPYCGGTGWRTSTTKAVVQESESETPPNIQALATWLYHHDPEWRKKQNGLDDDTNEENANGSVPIDRWINDNTEE